MTKVLRHNDPRCGRERFDARAGADWEFDPDPNETTYSIPDEPWRDYKRKMDAPKTLFGKGPWRVTTFGLELLSDVPSRYKDYSIPAHNLLAAREGGRVYQLPIRVANERWANFDHFEEAFRWAVAKYCRLPPSKPQPAPVNDLERLRAMILAGRQRPMVDPDMLETTFRRARAIARKTARRGE
jgi:hypothetical protein